QTEERFIEIEGQNSKDLHTQTPQDAYHSLAGKACTLLEAIEAKVLKLAFLLSMTTNSYQELQELLEKKYKILLK
ncbi:8008_t:CDS:2, partial [Cetraspora pellucida]